MNLFGVAIGTVTFILIGLFHVVVIKAEYHFSKKIWPVFFITGTALLAASLFLSSRMLSAIIAVLGISCLWSIKELFEQEKRVRRGWFPKKPAKQKVTHKHADLE